MNRWVKAKMLKTPEGIVSEIASQYLQEKKVFVRKYGLDQWIIWTGNPFVTHLIFSSQEAKKLIMTYRKNGRAQEVTEKENFDLNKDHLIMVKRI